MSGHDEEAFASAIGQLTPNGVTLVVLMGLGRSSEIACQLIDRRWSRGTPAAIIIDATRPDQQVWRGTLDQLARGATQDLALDEGAGTLVVGEVVSIGRPIVAQEQQERAACQL